MEKIIADFHVHTDASYGCLRTPQQTMAEAKEQGLEFIAITDHNTIYSLGRAKECEDKKTRVIPGIEFSVSSTTIEGPLKKDHILGLGMTNLSQMENYIKVLAIQKKDIINYIWAKFIINYFGSEERESFYRAVKERDPAFELKPCPRRWVMPKFQEIYKRFAEKEDFSERLENIPLQTTVVKKYIIDNFIVDPQKVLESQRWKDRLEEVMPEIFSAVYYRHPNHEDIIRLVKEAGGIAILAHPFEQKSLVPNLSFRNFLTVLKEIGLDGVELADYTQARRRMGVSPEANQKLTISMMAMAKELGLLVTVGSDNRGGVFEKLGTFGASYEVAKPVLERLGY